MIGLARPLQEEGVKLGGYSTSPVCVFANIAPVKIRNEIQHRPAPQIERIDAMHEGPDTDGKDRRRSGRGVDQILLLHHLAKAGTVEFDAALREQLCSKIIIDESRLACRYPHKAYGGEPVIKPLAQ